MMEYEAVLVRPEHLGAAGLSAGDVNEILAALAATVEPVRLTFLWRPMLKDPSDEMILETAANGRADLLVTFNIRHFTQAAGRFGIEVMPPPEAWRRLRKVQ
jgi:predicted nucleic acid-binding protein